MHEVNPPIRCAVPSIFPQRLRVHADQIHQLNRNLNMNSILRLSAASVGACLISLVVSLSSSLAMAAGSASPITTPLIPIQPSNFNVCISPSAKHQSSCKVFSATIGSGGQFQLTGLQPGVYDVALAGFDTKTYTVVRNGVLNGQLPRSKGGVDFNGTPPSVDGIIAFCNSRSCYQGLAMCVSASGGSPCLAIRE